MTFFNIFSKKQEKKNSEENKKAKIIIDNREKNSLVISELINLGTEIELKQLQIADYLVNDVAVERKTINDLQSSIINKRIFSQLKDLKQYRQNLYRFCLYCFRSFNCEKMRLFIIELCKSFIVFLSTAT